MGIFQADKVIFYHPCDDSTEFTQTADWTETTPTYAAGKVSNALAPTSGDAVGAFGTENEFVDNGSAEYNVVVALDSTRFAVVYRDVPETDGIARVGTLSGTDITFGAEHAFLSGNAYNLHAAALSSTQFVVAYMDNTSSNHGAAKVGTVSGNDITYGASNEFYSGGSAYDNRVERLSATKFVVAFDMNANTAGARVGTVAGSDITFGATTNFLGSRATDISLVVMDSSKVVVCYKSDSTTYGESNVGTVSGTDITFGSQHQFAGFNMSEVEAVALSATTLVVFYRLASSSNGGSKVGTVSGNDITYGAEVKFQDSDAAFWHSAAKISSSQFIIAFKDYSDNNGTTRVGTVAGTDITYGSQSDFCTTGGSGPQYVRIATVGSACVAAYQDQADSDHGTARAAALPTSAGSLANGPTGFSSGSEVEFLAADGALYTAVEALSATKFIVAYRDGADGSKGTAKVGTLSGADITFGAEHEFNAATTAYVALATLGASKFVVAYEDWGDSRHGTAKVGTVSGTDITFGAEHEFLSTGTGTHINIDALDSTRFVVAYKDDPDSGHGTARVGTVSGTDITFGADAEFTSSGGAESNSVATLSATKFVVAYQDGADSNHGTAKVGTVSGADITFGAEAEFLAANGAHRITAVALSDTKFVVAYRDSSDSNHGTAKVGTVAGTAITFGAEAEFKSDGQADPIAMAAMGPATVIVSWADTGGNGVSKVGTIGGADITFGPSDTFNAGGTDWISVGAMHAGPLPAAAAVADAAAAYSDGGDSNHGKAVSYRNAADPYPTVASETKVAFCGWFQKPSG